MTLYTYDVTFEAKDPKDTITKRVDAMSSTAAISTAAQALGLEPMQGHNWGVKVRLADLAAEEAHAAGYAPLYAELDDARAAFEGAGFAKVVGAIWYKHPFTGLVAYVDDPEAPTGHRAAGIYLHVIDPETGRDSMVPWVQIPWYGDGPDHAKGLALLRVALDAATAR